MGFFSACKTKEEAKAEFRRLAKLFHPDHGGDPTNMIKLKEQYDKWTPPKSNQWAGNKEYDVYGKHMKVPFDHPMYVELQRLRDRLAKYEPYGPRPGYEPKNWHKEYLHFKQAAEVNLEQARQFYEAYQEEKIKNKKLTEECEEHAREYNKLEESFEKLKKNQPKTLWQWIFRRY